MRMDAHRAWLILPLFFGSGATALVYEVVWSKYLALMFGSTVQAQTVVLAVFMGGLALGNRLFGRLSDRSGEPVKIYGYIELAIALYAFLFGVFYGWADKIFIGVGSKLLDHSHWLLLGKGILSVGLLLVPTVLMGGTLPLLASWLQRSTEQGGQQSARFYGVNSLGAVTGAGLAGFLFIPNLGLELTMQMTALANAAIGGLAIVLSRPSEPVNACLEGGVAASENVHAKPALNVAFLSLLVALTGGVSMSLEILASRSLVMIFGSSTQSFAVVLMAFILGIGIGSVVVASPRAPRASTDRLIVWLLLSAALWVGLLVYRIEWWVEVYRVVKSGLAPSVVGYWFYQAATGGMAVFILGVPAGLIGAVLPLLIRVLAQERSGLGASVGGLLTWNTVGAVVGVLLTGFVVMPALGLRMAFGLMTVILVATAFGLGRLRRVPWVEPCAGGAMVALIFFFALGGDDWRHVLSSGVFRARERQVDFQLMDVRKKHIEIVFYEDAPDATISVEHGDGIGASSDWGLRVNGKTDASSRVDLSTQMLIGHLPILARPDSQEVFLLGLGSAVTAGAILAHPVERLTVAENCEPVIRAAEYFRPWNDDAMDDPRFRILNEDARTVLKLSPRQYDVIITQPSNPWMAGIGSVFSQEYYRLAASRLKPGGMMVQWLQTYEMHDGIVDLIFRTFGSVFPVMEVWDSATGDVVLLGSDRPWPATAEHWATAFHRPKVQASFERIGIPNPTALWARQLASQSTAHAIAEVGPIESDLIPILEHEASRSLYLALSSHRLDQFDERTWQRDLAPSHKNRVLIGLEDATLRSVFGGFGSINQDLQRYLNWHSREGTNGLYPGTVPVVFDAWSSKSSPGTEREVSDTPLGIDAYVRLLRETPETSATGPEASTLNHLLSRHRSWSPEPSIERIVAVSKAMWNEGLKAEVRSILEQALEEYPDAMELRYLFRITQGHGVAGTP